MLKKFALFLIKKCLFNMFFFAGAHQTKYVCFCVHLSFYTQIYSSTILLSSFCPAVTEARNEFTKVAFDLRAPLRLVSLGQRGEAWHTRVHSTVAPAAAAAFVASLISIWRMQVYCVLWGTIYKSAEIISLARWRRQPLDLSWGKCDQNWMQSDRGQRQVSARWNRINYWCMLRCGFAVGDAPAPTRELTESALLSPLMKNHSKESPWSTTYSRCHLPFSHARRRLCKIAAERK